MNWKINVVFVDGYANLFDSNEQDEKIDSQWRFELAIFKIIEETGVIPIIGDWINPLSKDDYPLDIGLISYRQFDPAKQIIHFDIE